VGVASRATASSDGATSASVETQSGADDPVDQESHRARVASPKPLARRLPDPSQKLVDDRLTIRYVGRPPWDGWLAQRQAPHPLRAHQREDQRGESAVGVPDQMKAIEVERVDEFRQILGFD
jgi:hypothetical protein